MKQVPRTASFLGMPITNSIYDGATWLEGEEFCYPKGNMSRRARVLMPDGGYRVVRCGLPDTYFSIPAKVFMAGEPDSRGVLLGHIRAIPNCNGLQILEFVPNPKGE